MGAVGEGERHAWAHGGDRRGRGCLLAEGSHPLRAGSKRAWGGRGQPGSPGEEGPVGETPPASAGDGKYRDKSPPSAILPAPPWLLREPGSEDRSQPTPSPTLLPMFSLLSYFFSFMLTEDETQKYGEPCMFSLVF